MSNVLVMRGANFAEQRVEQIDFIEYDYLSVNWTEGYNILPNGTTGTNQNHKISNEFSVNGYKAIDLRSFGISGIAIAVFKDDSDNIVGVVTSTDALGSLVTVNVPNDAVKAQVAYIKDSRCAELGIPTLEQIKYYYT